jgi:hypothetical protein
MTDSDKSSKKTYYTKEELRTLKDINRRLQLMVDYKYQFRSGLLRGIGFAIGASIIGAIIVTIILNFFSGINSEFVQEVINNAESTNTQAQ